MMSEIFIPESVRKIVGESSYEMNEVGMSDSRVLIYEDHVLKIQKPSRETETEVKIASWLKGKLPVPEILVSETIDGRVYTLMTRNKGEMLCEEKYLTDQDHMMDLAAKGLRMLWQVDVTSCPVTETRLAERLKKARKLVEEGTVHTETIEDETYRKAGFKGPEELLIYLEENQPEEHPVLTHGDYCLPNIFVKDDKVSFIDIGKMGPADQWQDIAIGIRSIHHNLTGYYNGKVYGDFETEAFLKKLGVTMDKDKFRYYILLDELY